MNLNKICMGLIVLLAVLGITLGNTTDSNVAYGAGTWIKENQSSVGFSQLSAIIHVHIKNNAKHVQYFKISQNYTDSLETPINWTVQWTEPDASKMVDAVSPQLDGDWGWKIKPGETKEVTFKVSAYGMFGSVNSWISKADAAENIYWPLIPDQGIYSSWFQPNEIEILNPTLDLKYWKGKFTFLLTNFDDHSVSGIIRAPIVPTNSKLTYSDPKATFTDKDLTLGGSIAAWDVTMGAGTRKWFTYTYVWPSVSSSSSSSTGTFSSSVPTSSAASQTSSVPTKETGVPYGLFVVGGIIAAGGLVYARFMR